MYEDLVGSTGVLIMPTRGSAGPGEVLLRVNGSREAYIARSDAPIEQGATVLVVEAHGHRKVHVVRWTELPEVFGPSGDDAAGAPDALGFGRPDPTRAGPDGAGPTGRGTNGETDAATMVGAGMNSEKG